MFKSSYDPRPGRKPIAACFVVLSTETRETRPSIQSGRPTLPLPAREGLRAKGLRPFEHPDPRTALARAHRAAAELY